MKGVLVMLQAAPWQAHTMSQAHTLLRIVIATPRHQLDCGDFTQGPGASGQAGQVQAAGLAGGQNR
jgi:hypothetical protein